MTGKILLKLIWKAYRIIKAFELCVIDVPHALIRSPKR